MSDWDDVEWVTWVADDGTPNGVGYSVGADTCTYDGSLAEATSEVTWEAELDTDTTEPEVTLPLVQWAELVRKARVYDKLCDTCVARCLDGE